MPLKRTDIHASLKKKGFAESTGRDHTYFIYHTSSGKKSHINTKTSHGTSHKDIGDPIVVQMAKQLKLTNKQFKELVGCSMDQSAYEIQLLEGNHITVENTKYATDDGGIDFV